MEIPAGLIEFMTGLRIPDPLIELLAIKLYEHDTGHWPPSIYRAGWLRVPEADRELYRTLARGGGTVCEPVKVQVGPDEVQIGPDSSKSLLKTP